MKKIAAIILTMNRKEMLFECIKSLINKKINKIIIVDNNGSKENIKKFVEKKFKSEKISIIENKINLGSAGGYNAGIKEAIKQKMEWVWLFDDDCEATENSLKELKRAKHILEKDKIKIGFLVSKQNLLDEGNFPLSIRFNSLTWLKYINESLLEINWSVYTGLLLNLNAVAKQGLPIKKMFLYQDDTEFTYRISKKFKGFLVGKSEIIHKDYLSKRKYVSAPKKSKEKLRRLKYFTRNSVYFTKVLLKEKGNKNLAYIHFFSVLKNPLIKTLFSRNFLWFFPLSLWFIKGFFFNPKIEKIK